MKHIFNLRVSAFSGWIRYVTTRTNGKGSFNPGPRGSAEQGRELMFLTGALPSEVFD